MLKQIPKHASFTLSLLALVYLLVSPVSLAQSAAFTYQGRLTDAGNLADGVYDFQFKLFDSQAPGTGTQHGNTVSLTNVDVTNGVFIVELDFGLAVFDGSARFLEVGIRPAGSPGAYTLLSPRQPINSSPYAVRSATAGAADSATNAAQLGGLTSSGFIKNTSTQQAATNFNIGGTGTANILNAQTQFNIGGNRVLSVAGNANTFVGINAGRSNAGGQGNSFFGTSAGDANTTGGANAFFGTQAGAGNTTGSANSFFGGGAGFSNTTGNGNSFFGRDAGFLNTGGVNNSFFGDRAGVANTTGNFNSFYGEQAGANNTTGADNTFVGRTAGIANTTASGNSYFGSGAGQNATGGGNSFFGSGAGRNTTTGTSNSFFGRGAGEDNTTGVSNVFLGHFSGGNNTTGGHNIFIGFDSRFSSSPGTGNDNILIGRNTVVAAASSNSVAIGAGASVFATNTIVLGTSAENVVIPGDLNVQGSKNFKIDHPLDPQNKYLYHAAIESSEVLNIYSGNITTDKNGVAVVTLPEWFESINRDFRYQLTVIGRFAQAIVASEIRNNRFTIKTNATKVKVSWQVTGIRSDVFMLKRPFKVEEEKTEIERGIYLSPETQIKEKREQMKQKTQADFQ